MKTITHLPLLFLLLVAMACQSQRATYLAIGSITTTANAAIGAYDDYDIAFPQPRETTLKARKAINAYNKAVDVAEAAVKSYNEGKATKESAQLAVDALSASAGDLIAFIRTIVPPERMPKP